MDSYLAAIDCYIGNPVRWEIARAITRHELRGSLVECDINESLGDSSRGEICTFFSNVGNLSFSALEEFMYEIFRIAVAHGFAKCLYSPANVNFSFNIWRTEFPARFFDIFKIYPAKMKKCIPELISRTIEHGDHQLFANFCSGHGFEYDDIAECLSFMVAEFSNEYPESAEFYADYAKHIREYYDEKSAAIIN